ncbi:MAG TPA: ATP-binding protein [Acidimicrobiia bacterium]|nr:ATP-binding protein [Acidimicrobiia bacterium]
MTARSFTSAPTSAAAARRFVVGELGDVPTDIRESITLMVSELASNAIRHARTPFTVSVERTGDVVKVEVTDSGSGDPVRRSPDPSEPAGRGLRIVDALADEWGVHHARGADKTVWFSIDVHSDRTLAS